MAYTLYIAGPFKGDQSEFGNKVAAATGGKHSGGTRGGNCYIDFAKKADAIAAVAVIRKQFPRNPVATQCEYRANCVKLSWDNALRSNGYEAAAAWFAKVYPKLPIPAKI